jgi:membrane protein
MTQEILDEKENNEPHQQELTQEEKAKVEEQLQKYHSLKTKFDEAKGWRKWWYGTILVILEFFDDLCNVQAAAISYFTVVSIFPLILGSLTITFIFIGDNAEIRNNFINLITNWIPGLNNVGIDVPGLYDGFTDFLRGRDWYLAIAFLLLALWTGSSIFDGIMNAANAVFEIRGDRRNFFYKILLRFIMLFIIGGVLLLSQLLTLVITIALNFNLFDIRLSNFVFLLDLINFTLPMFLVWLALLALYYLAPDYRPIKFKALCLGAFLGALGIQLAKYILSLYFGAFNGANGYAVTYGALAGIFIFIFYIYVNAMVLLFGMEVVAIATGVNKTNNMEKAYAQMIITFIPKNEDGKIDVEEVSQSLKKLLSKNGKPKVRIAPKQSHEKQNQSKESVHAPVEKVEDEI